MSVAGKNKSVLVRIATPRGWRLQLGESVAVNGICSTVRAPLEASRKQLLNTGFRPLTGQATNARHFEVEYMPETLSKTTAGSWRAGDLVNLERSLRYGDPISGHFVQGHIDAQGTIVKIIQRGSSREISIRVPQSAIHLVAPKGSVSVNGVSLTAVAAGGTVFTVALVSYTIEHTNLGLLKKRDLVNVETDMIARYLALLMQK